MTADIPTPLPAPSDLTIPEVAAELKSTQKFIRLLIKRGDLEAVRYGTRFVRVPRASLDAFKAAHSTRPRLDPGVEKSLREKACAAKPFTEEQKDTVRAAFRARGP